MICITIERIIQRILVLVLNLQIRLRANKLHLLGLWSRHHIWRCVSYWVWSCWKSMLELRIRCHLHHVWILTHYSHWCHWHIMTAYITVLVRWIHMYQAGISRYKCLIRRYMLLIVPLMIKLIPYRFLHRTVNYMLPSEVVLGAPLRLKLILIVRRPLHPPSCVIFNVLVRLIHDLSLMLVPHFFDFRFQIWEVSLTGDLPTG